MEDIILNTINEKEDKEKDDLSPKIYDDVEIIIDPKLEDESTVDIAEYFNKHILQCRVCGNMFPSDKILTDEDECPICGETSSDGYIYKGKLGNVSDDENDDSNTDEIDMNFDDYENDLDVDIEEDKSDEEISFNVENEEPQITIKN